VQVVKLWRAIDTSVILLIVSRVEEECQHCCLILVSTFCGLQDGSLPNQAPVVQLVKHKGAFCLFHMHVILHGSGLADLLIGSLSVDSICMHAASRHYSVATALALGPV